MKYLIVDDHPLVLKALEAEMGKESHCLLANSLRQSLEHIEGHPDIDLILLDLKLPDSSGTQGLCRLRAAAPATPILILSGNTDPAEIKQVIEFGAAGFVIKSAELTVLRQAMALVLAGGTYIPPEIFGLRAEVSNRSQKNDAIEPDLTPREKEILPFLALGHSNKRIAEQLDVSENTIRVHVAHIMKKLDVTNRTQAASRFLRDAMQSDILI